jgi:WhiB family redox-sensing transcriptional regulator
VENWKLAGACRDRDPNLFFPENDRWAERRAKAICEGCMVRAQCLDVALRGNDVGIWGGTTERERKKIKARYVRPSKALDAMASVR